jgi:cyclopropane-fatty-acyl-phospholipid synthase
MLSDKFYQKLVMRMLQKMQSGRLALTMPNGDMMLIGNGEGIPADMKINSPEFFAQIVLHGDVGFGEAYTRKLWETSSLTNLISWLIENRQHIPSISGSRKIISPINLLKVSNRVLHILKPNSLSGSRKNISKHYDLSNKFFKSFLDKTMTYSSALFTPQAQTLEKAQLKKYDSLCKMTGIRSGDHVLEIGCGWGGFAIYAAKTYDCKVTGITISQEQFNFARRRVAKENLTGKVEILLQDYRKVKGTFDKIISIEMIEAVGHKYFSTYFSKINELLKSDGILGIQAIIIPDSRYNEYRKGVDWIQKHIFPGGLLPSIGVINKTIGKVSDMYLQHLKEFGLSYGKTLKIWYENLYANLDNIKTSGFDDAFIRKWEYYLCYCEAAFRSRNINVVQMVYSRPNNTKYLQLDDFTGKQDE